MPKIALAAYSITVHRLRSSQEKCILSMFDGEASLFDLLVNYCTDLEKEPYHDEDDRRLMDVEHFTSDSDTVAGRVRTGEYGYESELVDVDAASTSYKRSSADAEMLPFYFLFHVPQNSERGVAIFQRFGNSGIRTLFTQSFSSYFQEAHPSFRVTLQPLVHNELLQHYLDQGELKKLEFTRFSLPADVADVLNVDGFREHLDSVKIVISAKRNRFFPEPTWLRRLARGDGLQNIVELSDLGYEKLRIEVKLGTSIKKIDITDLNRLRGYFDITDELSLGTSGHPEFDDIHHTATNLLNDIVEEIIDPNANET
ncbi:MAG: hypothetical protein R3A44_38470 [Caldilineaceae bacterium]